MARLLNNETKQIETVPDEFVTKGIASGLYSPRVGSVMRVISPTGDIGEIDASQAQLSFQNGYQYQTREQEKQLTDQKIKDIWRQEMDMPVTAAAAGALRGLTFGLSDVAARAIGGAEVAEGLRQVKEVSPTISAVGEVGGAVVGALGTGLAGVGARAATKAGAAVGEATIGRLAAKYGTNSVITRAAQAAAGTAVEGALYGAGEVISEAALNDPKLSAQHALATIGTGAALGGAFGGLTKVGGEAIIKLKSLLQESSLPTATADTLGKLFSKVSSLTRGMDDETAALQKEYIATREGRDLIAKAMQDRNVNQETIKNSLIEVKKTGDSIETIWGEARKGARAELDSKGAGPLRFTVRKEINNVIDSAINKVQKESKFYSSDTIPTLNQIKNNLSEDMANVTNRADLHEKVEYYRKLIDSKMDFAIAERSGTTSRTEAIYGDIRKTMSDILTDPNKFGKFADTYGDLNAAYNKFRTTKKDFLKNFASKQINENGIEEIMIDTSKVSSYFRNTENVKNSLKELKFESYLSAIKDLEAAAKKTGTTNPEISSFLLKEADTAKNTFDTIKRARVAELFMNNLETRTGKGTIGTLIGGLVGTPFGIPGQLAGAAVGSAIANPRSFLNILLSIENHGIAGQQRLQGAVSKFYGNKLAEGITRNVALAAKPITIKGALEYLSHQGSTVQDLKAAIDEHVQDPQKIWKTFDDNNHGIDEVAPNYSTEMINVMHRGLQFLQQKMPANYTQDMFGNKAAPISDSQKRSIEAYTDAIFRPGRIFEELEKSRPDPKVIEAVQAVYPELYGQLQNEIMRQAVDSKVPYEKKLVIGKLFAVPTTASLEQINHLQKSFKPTMPVQQMQRPQKFEMRTIAQHQTNIDTLIQ